MGAMFMFILSCNPEHQSLGRELLHVLIIPLSISCILVFVAATQGTWLWSALALARGTCIPGFQRTLTIGGTVLGRVPPPGH